MGDKNLEKEVPAKPVQKKQAPRASFVITTDAADLPETIVIRQAEKKEKGFPRTLWVIDFSLGTAQMLSERLYEFHQKDPESPVLLMIPSYGGGVDGLLPMIDTIRTFPLEIRTCAFGVAMSCGAVLLSSGTKGKRYILPNTRIMIHEISGWSFGNAADIENTAEEIKRINEVVNGILAENCGVSLEELMTELRGKDGVREHYFDAQGALQFGMVDEIVSDLTSIIPPPSEEESSESDMIQDVEGGYEVD